MLCSVTGIISVISCTAAFSPPCPTLPIPRAAHATAHASSISPYPGALYTKHDVILIAHTSNLQATYLHSFAAAAAQSSASARRCGPDALRIAAYLA